jgi:hypothetical protein
LGLDATIVPSPRDLPIYELESAIVAALRAAPARLIVQAPTGSGKSTQLPQMLLRHGFLDGGEVVVLQPRRLATRLLAKRVAEEVGAPLGDVVGYQIRLESRVSERRASASSPRAFCSGRCRSIRGCAASMCSSSTSFTSAISTATSRWRGPCRSSRPCGPT